MIGKGEILVIDDFIDLEYQEKIKDNLMGDNDFPWYYIDDVTAAYEEGNQGRPGLSHVYVDLDDDNSSEIISDFHDLFLPLLRHACYTLNIPQASVLQGRSFLQFPLNLNSFEEPVKYYDGGGSIHL